jgi:hypothetical protein
MKRQTESNLVITDVLLGSVKLRLRADSQKGVAAAQDNQE